MIPRATYRLQFHRDFPFARAEALVPYFERLGISHIYASPITTACKGSMHGYDVVDPTRVNPELGGEEALRSLVAALRERAMDLIIDIVPNHMGIAGGENPWWNDVLTNGPESAFANYFDIDWSKKLLLPILGAPLAEVIANGEMTLDYAGEEPQLLIYGERRVPLRPETREKLPAAGDKDGLAALVDRQHYRLGWWRTANDEINWRRFFAINDLAGLRAEDPEVFEATHALYFRLWGEGLIDGVRIDHIDGLSDPATYLHRLRERFAGIVRPEGAPEGSAYIVVEKILAAGELLPADWPVEGTSGYEFMDEASAVLHDAAGEAPLTAIWRKFSGRSGNFHAEELIAREQLLDWQFQAQLEACVDAFVSLAATSPETAPWTRTMLRRAIERLIWAFPAYRTYGTGSAAPPEDAALHDEVRRKVVPLTPPGEAAMAEAILAWLAGEGPGDPTLAAEAVRRFQQLSAPIAAKAVEDTAFYRHGVLLSRTDVGFDPNRFAMSAAEFLATCAERAQRRPHAMLATATHDHKRGEDVRARLSVLSQIAGDWAEAVSEWERLAEGTSSALGPGDRYITYQTFFGAWPEGLAPDDVEGMADYAERLKQWQTKALREAKLRSNWAEPNEAYEAAGHSLIELLCDPAGPIAPRVAALVEDVRPAARVAMIAQAAMCCLLPGVPDCYQGCELPDYSLVDPDNRRPVDYERRERMIAGEVEEHPKFAQLRELLALRRAAPELFAHGDLAPAEISGERSANVLAFSRRHEGAFIHCAIVVKAGAALLRRSELHPPPAWWGDTTIAFAGEEGSPRLAREIFAEGPVFIAFGAGEGQG